MLKIALPNKGRLADEVRATLTDAGLDVRAASERSLTASLGNEFAALFVRAEDIPAFVADGAADAGITGWDLVLESGRALDDLLDLGFGRCRLAVAMPKAAAGAPAPSLEDVKDGARVATKFGNLAEAFFGKLGLRICVVHLSGAAEVAPHLGIADVVVDLVSTGSTLRVNGLVEVATIVDSSARLVARPRSAIGEDATQRLSELALALESVVRARGQRYLMANAPREALEKVREILPGISGPTIIDVAGGAAPMVAVHAVVAQKAVYRTIANLKAAGCTGILVTRIERLTP
jgi:ATP phosphoribosyltransferase